MRVFVPAMFLPGLTGSFFRQFAVTISVSTVLSAINSLTLSPALCPILLKGHGAKKDPLEWLIHATVGWWFFRGFNYAFERATNIYGWSIGKMMRLAVFVLVAFGGLLVLTGKAFTSVPAGFIPQQDQGYLVINVQLPDGASLERTQVVMKQVDEACLGKLQPDGTRKGGVRGIDHVIGLGGYSIFASASISNAGGCYLSLAPFNQRKGRHADDILKELNGRLAGIMEGSVTAFGAPPILGLGNAGGFKLQIQDRGGVGLPASRG